MKLISISIASLSVFLVMVQCNSTKPSGTPFSGKHCPMERIDWMKTTNTYSKTTVINLAAKIRAAATADGSQLKKIATGQAGVSFGDSLTKTITNIVADSAQVSQEFYQAYLTQRQALCNMYELANSRIFKNDSTFIRRLQDQYFEVTKAFAQVQSNEEKKNQP